ncbi:MAG: hypothetical protein AB7L28_29050 [Kofleriaceae bacterium]
MRALLLIVIASCSGGSSPHPAPPVPTEQRIPRCSDAAAGIERATRSVRDPEQSVLAEMQGRCTQDHWSTEAIDCFSKMTAEDLGACAERLDPRARNAMFGILDGTGHDRAGLIVMVARLSTLRVGIPECDQFVAAVSRAMSCEGLELETRLQLGAETADFWSLPTSGLPADAARKMAAACSKSLQSLQQQASDAGCML